MLSVNFIASTKPIEKVMPVEFLQNDIPNDGVDTDRSLAKVQLNQ